jgi:hypothetical protein
MIAECSFSFIADESTRFMFEDMYAAITKAEAWEWIKQDPGDGGFMFNDSEKSRQIAKNLTDRVGHSGSSYGWTMRSMQRLALIGWSAFIQEHSS